MTDPTSAFQPLHSAYCRLTGLAVTLNYWREHCWHDWKKQGFTEADLELVVAYLQREIREGRRTLACLKFSNLIERVDWFEETLSIARVMQRRPKLDKPRSRILVATGRPAEPEPVKIKPVAEIVADRMQFLAKLKQLRESL